MKDFMGKYGLLVIVFVITFAVTMIATYSMTRYSVMSMPTMAVDRQTGESLIIGKTATRDGRYEIPITLSKDFGPYKIEQYINGRRIVIVKSVNADKK